MGVIAGRAVRAFLARKRKDYRPWKEYTHAKLRAIRDARLPIRPPVWSVLRIHQKVCLLIGALEHYFAFFLDTGMGKTFLSIALVKYFQKLNPEKRQRFLVLVPNKTNKTEWVREVRKHAPDLLIIKMVGSSVQKWDTLLDNPDADLVVETYAGMMHMVSKLVENKSKRKTKATTKRKMVWNDSLVRKFAAQFDGMIMDESIKVMNKSSLPHRICYQIRKRMSYAFELNGTPFGRDPMPVWGQVYLLDLGETLGETQGLFRSAFYKSKDTHWGGIDYTFDKTKRRMLHDFLGARTISYEADEADLPAVVPIEKIITLAADAETYAEQAKAAIIAKHGSYQETKNAFLRMRQISSGFLGYKDDETGERASIVFRPNHKLEALVDFVDNLNPKYKWIVFHEFNYSGGLIRGALKEELGIDAAWIYGKSKDPDAELRRFLGSTNCPGLILSNSAGAYGLNLQIAKYGIYYEAPVSPIIRYQTRKRFERQESPHKTVFRVDLIVAGTYDRAILKFHEDGKDMFDAIIRGKFKTTKSGLLIPG